MKSSCWKPGLRVALEDQCPSIVPRLRKISYEGVVIWKEVAKHHLRNFKDTTYITCFNNVLHHVIEANESTGIFAWICHDLPKNTVPRSVLKLSVKFPSLFVFHRLRDVMFLTQVLLRQRGVSLLDFLGTSWGVGFSMMSTVHFRRVWMVIASMYGIYLPVIYPKHLVSWIYMGNVGTW